MSLKHCLLKSPVLNASSHTPNPMLDDILRQMTGNLRNLDVVSSHNTNIYIPTSSSELGMFRLLYSEVRPSHLLFYIQAEIAVDEVVGSKTIILSFTNYGFVHSQDL